MARLLVRRRMAQTSTLTTGTVGTNLTTPLNSLDLLEAQTPDPSPKNIHNNADRVSGGAERTSAMTTPRKRRRWTTSGLSAPHSSVSFGSSHSHPRRRQSSANESSYSHRFRHRDSMNENTDGRSAKDHDHRSLSRMWIGFTLAILVISGYWRFGYLLTFDNLRKEHRNIALFISHYPKMSPLLYMLLVSTVVGLSLPGATPLSMAAGLFWPQPWSSIYAWLGCATGAVLCFLLVKSICTDYLRKKIDTESGLFHSFEQGLKKNELAYLIYVRYMIFIPFWFVNVAAAILEARFKVFLLSSFLATIPGSVLYTSSGRGLITAFEAYNEEVTVISLLKQVVFSEDIKWCLILLLICGSFPIGMHYWDKHYSNNEIAMVKKNDGHRYPNNNHSNHHNTSVLHHCNDLDRFGGMMDLKQSIQGENDGNLLGHIWKLISVTLSRVNPSSNINSPSKKNVILLKKRVHH